MLKNRARSKPNASVGDILKPFPPRVKGTAEQLRRLVMRAIPTATEHAYSGWKAIGDRDPQAGYFAGIFPQQDHVRLLFEHGAALEDHDGLLEGDNVKASPLDRPAAERAAPSGSNSGSVASRGAPRKHTKAKQPLTSAGITPSP